VLRLAKHGVLATEANLAMNILFDAECRVPSFLTIIAAVSLTIWAYLVFARGAFWRLRPFDDDIASHQWPQAWPSIVAIVPARNECATIRQSLTGLLRQDYSGEFSVMVVDDHSEDDTAEIARKTARELHAEARATICSASALPPGWTGKLWALNEGVAHAGGSAPAYYWLTDADIVHAPATLRRFVARAERDQLYLTSLMVLLQARTLPERALIPAFLFFFLKLYPPRWIAQAKARTAGAAGGCMLLRREALDRIGGLAPIRGEVIDDCALAQAIKRSGGRIWMGLTRASVSLREYRSFGEIRDMIARTAFTQLRYSTLLLIVTFVGMLLTYAAPVGLLFAPSVTARILAACVWALMSLLYLPMLRFYRLSPFWAPLLPASALFYTYATVLSAIRHWRGRGAQWKGRSHAHQNRSFG
jgi:hopene-associated glycosyltransferase HpnB